jgi:RNA polymerase sigma factor (sigma-70 family)
MAPEIDRASVEQLYNRAGASRWQLSIDDFACALTASVTKAFAGQTPTAREIRHYIDSLRHEDLALACACAAGHEAAWEHFVLQYRPILYRAADALDPGGGARELADSLYADLFGLDIHKGERRSLFRYFHGRSSLATWLRAVLAQRLVDRARAESRTEPIPDDGPATPAGHTGDHDRGRYLALVHHAFRAALVGLDTKARLRIRYYYVPGLTLAETGRVLGEHEASVSRHLAAARKVIRRDIERGLAQSGLGPDEIARCFACVAEDAGPLDLDRLLAAVPGARNPESGVQSEERPAGISAAVSSRRSS